MTHVRFAPEVPDELAAAVLWYEARRQGLGREFLDEVQATLPLVDERPRSFPRLQAVDATLEIRRALLARFPYALVFFVRPGCATKHDPSPYRRSVSMRAASAAGCCRRLGK